MCLVDSLKTNQPLLSSVERQRRYRENQQGSTQGGPSDKNRKRAMSPTPGSAITGLLFKNLKSIY